MSRAKAAPQTEAPPQAPPESEKPRRTIAPESPAGIRNAWSRALNEYNRLAARVAKAQADLKDLETELAAAKKDLDVAAEKVRAQLPAVTAPAPPAK